MEKIDYVADQEEISNYNLVLVAALIKVQTTFSNVISLNYATTQKGFWSKPISGRFPDGCKTRPAPERFQSDWRCSAENIESPPHVMKKFRLGR